MSQLFNEYIRVSSGLNIFDSASCSSCGESYNSSWDKLFPELRKEACSRGLVCGTCGNTCTQIAAGAALLMECLGYPSTRQAVEAGDVPEWFFYIEGRHYIRVLISTPTGKRSTPEKVLVIGKGGNLPCKRGDWMTGEAFGRMLKNQAGNQWRCNPSALWWAEENRLIGPDAINGERERAIARIKESDWLLEKILDIMKEYNL